MERNIRRLTRISLVCVFLVVLAGSVVRMTGSGMGCPDWPKCFGYYIPPTNENQVTWQADHPYKQGHMIVKGNELLVAKSDFTTGTEFQADNWEKYDTHNYAIFNKYHTWTEYVNRLIGAFTGLPMLLLFFFSVLMWKKDPIIPLLATGSVLLLGFEAWLGKVVVDSNLQEYRITLHMAGALGIILLLQTLLWRSGGGKEKVEVKPWFRWLLFTALFVGFIQIYLGTQVREGIDVLYRSGLPRNEWINNIGNEFIVHRSFAWLVILLTTLIFWFNRRLQTSLREVLYLTAIILAEALSGIVLSYAGMIKWLQPLHLIFAFLSIALLYFALLRTYSHQRKAVIAR
jgi:cytochrome c oxidase assembly protein subunit 15